MKTNTTTSMTNRNVNLQKDISICAVSTVSQLQYLAWVIMVLVHCAIIIANDYVSVVVTSGKCKQNTK